MLKKWFTRRNLAILSLILYCFDTGSDLWVSIDLIFLKCHVRYGLTVFAFVLLPGVFLGCYRFSQDKKWKHLYRALVFPIWHLPYTIKSFFLAINNSTSTNEDPSEDENKAKK